MQLLRSEKFVSVEFQAEIETHVQPGALTVYVHYGQSRPRDAKSLARSDVVLTTYGVLASEFSAEVIHEFLISEVLFFCMSFRFYICSY